MMIRNLLVLLFVMSVGWQPLWCFADDEAPPAQDSAPAVSGSADRASTDTGQTGQDEGSAPVVEGGSSNPTKVEKHGPVMELHDVRTASTILAHDAIRSDLHPLGVVSGAPSGKVLLSVGDTISVRFESSAKPKPHDLLAVVRPTHVVRHPRSHQSMGQLVEVVGVIELDQEVGPFWSGRIVQSPDFMSIGDVVINLDSESEKGAPTASVTAGDGSGYVVAIPDERVLVGAFQTVYTDLGLNHGVRPGQVFMIIREGSSGAPGTVSRTIGEARVVSVQPASSAVLVLKSAEPIEIGDRIEARSDSTPR